MTAPQGIAGRCSHERAPPKDLAGSKSQKEDTYQAVDER